MALPNWLKVQVSDLDARPDDDKVLQFPHRGTEAQADNDRSAIDLIYEAARLVSDIEHRAHHTESRARSLCSQAMEKVRMAERIAEAAEAEIRSLETRLAEAEAELGAAELRARNAEARAEELDRALAVIEENIRSRLLGETSVRRNLEDELAGLRGRSPARRRSA